MCPWQFTRFSPMLTFLPHSHHHTKQGCNLQLSRISIYLKFGKSRKVSTDKTSVSNVGFNWNQWKQVSLMLDSTETVELYPTPGAISVLNTTPISPYKYQTNSYIPLRVKLQNQLPHFLYTHLTITHHIFPLFDFLHLSFWNGKQCSSISTWEKHFGFTWSKAGHGKTLLPWYICLIYSIYFFYVVYLYLFLISIYAII